MLGWTTFRCTVCGYEFDWPEISTVMPHCTSHPIAPVEYKVITGWEWNRVQDART
jgi:predicted Zn-ribbon and HTH transcriptional regulator